MVTTKLDEDVLDLLREYKLKLKTPHSGAITMSQVIRLLVKSHVEHNAKGGAKKFIFGKK